MFDLHVVRLLRDAWENTYGSTLVDFRKIFHGFTTLGNWDAIIQEWWDELSQPGYIQFRAALNLTALQHPQVVVTLEEEPSEYQPLGFESGFASDGSPVRGMYVDQTAVIRVFAKHGEHVRVLHELCRQVMIANVGFFGRLGFAGLRFHSGTDIEPQAEEMPELLGISVRSQRWSTTYQPQVVLDKPSGAQGVFVHADDVTIAGVQGGVVASTELSAGAAGQGTLGQLDFSKTTNSPWVAAL